MAEEAAKIGNNITVLATFRPTLKPTTDLIKRKNPNAEIKTILIDEAYTALGNGDRQKHDCLILEKVSEEAENADVIVLAQASMASALENSGLDTDKILTSPVLGIKKLKKILEENN